MQAADMPHARKAALLLHALRENERGRVWARLDETQQGLLTPLLHELKALGIPAGRSWVGLDEGQTRFESLADQGVSLAQAQAALRRQSLGTVVAVLQAHPWSWATALVSQWPAPTRHDLQALMAQQRALPPALGKVLLEQFVREAKELAATMPETGRPVRRRLPWHKRFFGQ